MSDTRALATGRLPRRADARGIRLLIAVAVVAALAVGVSVALPADPAFATSYPSWSDVQKAKANVTKAQRAAQHLSRLITQLQQEATAAQDAAIAAGDKMQAAQEAYFVADHKATELQEQADKLKKESDTATTRAGQVAAELYRSGGRDVTASLLFSGTDGTSTAPDALLDQLGSMTKLAESTSDIYASAVQAKNTAASVAAQAQEAKKTRAEMKKKADEAFDAAVKASQVAAAKVKEEQDHKLVLNAQLKALKDKSAKTVAKYKKGVIAARKAAAAKAKAAAAAAARAQAVVNSQGWAVPAVGWISDGFGPRPAPCAGCSTWHLGADIANNYNTPIHAAHSGTVVYAGWESGYGNFIIIDDGDGIQTAYGHIIDGGIMVGYGQHVSAGQQIARMGSTGHSTGPHLHFEVRINGVQTDPIAWMKNHGAPLG
ncbi:M23 family metallopeptidase [Gryllotalpicola ginsengisoli]|uniref:M23 family metallopeptidase n=1 Tax=Gryllotalpicola ginsengisoli TaxID=444608 RepID=UPI0003B5ACB2|nr:M23 family metallopeptidase [Gryllotalpicola ginsengisoli]